MIKKYWKDFLSLIYPNLCYGCDVPLVEGEDKICLRCYRDFPLSKHHLSKPNPLIQMTTTDLKIHNAFCYIKFNKNGIAQKLLYELKYNGNTAIGLLLGEWFANYIEKELNDAKIDCILPVPLHKSKVRKRGYNQSEIIAQGMFQALGIPVLTNVLIRSKKRSTQTKKGKVERWQNVDALYEIIDKKALYGKNAFLLDDVITTGATIGAAAEVLAKTEINKIYLGCIASGK